jgi:hypothetical protein
MHMIVHRVMQVLINLELATSKAYISLHGEWFVDNVCVCFTFLFFIMPFFEMRLIARTNIVWNMSYVLQVCHVVPNCFCS